MTVRFVSVWLNVVCPFLPVSPLVVLDGLMVGIDQVYVVFVGTPDWFIFSVDPLQTVAVWFKLTIFGNGLTVTIALNVVPLHLSVIGVTT